MTEITVEVEEEPQVEAINPVIVVDSGTADEVPAYVLDLTERIVNLENRVAAVEAKSVEAVVIADSALNTADAAADVVGEALDVATTALDVANEVAEVAVATAEETGVAEEVAELTSGDLIPDVTPRKEHWLFRSADDWKRKVGDSAA